MSTRYTITYSPLITEVQPYRFAYMTWWSGICLRAISLFSMSFCYLQVCWYIQWKFIICFMGEWRVSENCTLVKEGSEACLKMCIRCRDHSMGVINRIMRWWLTSPMSLGMLIDWNSATFHNRDSSAQTGRIWHHPSAMCSKTGGLGT